MAIPNDWLNLSQAAGLVGVHPATLRQWADSGEIPSQRTPGGHRRFRRDELEAWQAAESRGHSAGAQVIVQNTLGRARLMIAEGEFERYGWYQRLNEDTRHALQHTGRQLLSLVMRYLAHDGQDEAALDEARAIGRDYQRLGRQSGLTLVETAQAYLFFRELLFQTVYDMTAAAGAHGPTNWGQMRAQISVFTNEALLALLAAHEEHG